MSWQIASFAILALVLVGGMVWYERGRPPSQVVALVAVLAALAVAGRVALAPIPNLVATTDIVLFAGYALGAGPGFAVGALGGLISNFWLGQGPWTPWQMAAWGMTGVLGAALFRITRGGAGRLRLAAAGAIAGVGFGAIMNFSVMAGFGGDLTLERYLALEVRAIPFDLAHVIGNVAFALVAGPAMVAALRRFRDRFEWRQAGAAAGVLAIGLVAAGIGLASPPSADAASKPDVDSGRAWLISNQNADGGFGASPDQESSSEMTAWATIGLAASGRNPLDVRKNGKTPISYLRSEISSVRGPADLARTILAIDSAGLDPSDFGGRNLVKSLLSTRRDNGSYEGWPNTTAAAVIALRAVRLTGAIPKSLSWLRKVQNPNGGWGVTPRSPSDADSTGMVLQAVTGGDSAAAAIAYLRKAQRPGGGFTVGPSTPVNTQSTALAVQGLLAAGASPAGFKKAGASPYDYLAGHQKSDGHFRYSSSSDQTPVWVTATVLPAAARKTLPIDPPKRSTRGDGGDDGTGSDGTDDGGAGPGGSDGGDGTSTTTNPTYTPPPADFDPSDSNGTNSPDYGTHSGDGRGDGSGHDQESPGSGFPGDDSGAGGGRPDSGAEPSSPGLPAAPPAAMTAADPSSASAPLAIAIGLAVAGIAIGATVGLGRKFSW